MTVGLRRWVMMGALIFGALVLALGGTYAWLFLDGGAPAGPEYRLDMTAIRAEATKLPGGRAQRVEVETVSHTLTPKIAMVAATDWSKIDLIRVSYRVVLPDQTIIIDTTYDAPTARAAKVDRFDTDAFARVLGAMRSATKIVVTHEHADHLGGLLTSPDWPNLAPKALITDTQYAHVERTVPVAWPPLSRQTFKPIHYDQLLAIAPGVVLIRAAGHTPGSQMIYVQRADGQEYIFMGDTASMADNVRLNRLRSRLVTDFMTHDDRTALMAQTKALHALWLKAPKIALVPGHDAEEIGKFQRSGLLKTGFSH